MDVICVDECYFRHLMVNVGVWWWIMYMLKIIAGI